ncbi:MAG: metallophosphoesterase [Bradyrhizobiaceae bacterium]|nr:metallophosphoesterase [Bradyrhizobiaceae bacterium]
MFVLAHLSDPHLSPLPSPGIGELMSKRLVGYINWYLRRSPHHDPRALDKIVRDLQAQQTDHIAVLGDLINISLPAEYPMGRALLIRLGSPENVTLVPGNHDAYVRTARETYLSAWGEYLLGDRGTTQGNPFPFVRKRGKVALIGLSTALPTLPFLATGTVGKAQLDRLAGLLPALEREGFFRVVLIHHPPAGKRKPHKILTDAAAFRAVIAAHGAELILHGHDHRQSHLAIAGPRGEVPVLGVPSASAPPADERPAAYNLYRVGGAPGTWTCELETRGFRPDGTIATLARSSLSEAGLSAAPAR